MSIRINGLTKRELRANNKRDSNRLFNAVWRAILQFNQDCGVDDIQALYDQMVSNRVNDSKSIFYIYG